jgi:putative ABC transport system permease protein
MALGAERNSVARMVLRQGASLALTGAGIGLVASLASAWCLASLLYGVAPYDPVVFFVAPLTPVGLALLGSYLPARSAMRTEPVVALRYE